MAAPNNTFFIKQGDTSPEIEEYLRNADGTPIPLAGATVAFHMRAGDGTVKVNSAASIVDTTTARVKYSWVGADTNTSGTYYREWEVTLNGGRIVTTPNYLDYPVQIAAQIA